MLFHFKNAHNIDNPKSERKIIHARSVLSMFNEAKPYPPGSKKQMELNQSLARLIVRDMRPVNTVQTESFKDYTSLLDPRY